MFVFEKRKKKKSIYVQYKPTTGTILILCRITKTVLTSDERWKEELYQYVGAATLCSYGTLSLAHLEFTPGFPVTRCRAMILLFPH